MRTTVKVDTHGCTFDYFIALIHMFPKGEYVSPKDDSCYWFTFEGFTFFLDMEFYQQYREYRKIGEEEE